MSKQETHKAWVVVAPFGLRWVGLCLDEAEAWSIALDYRPGVNIEELKQLGWYAAKADVTWSKP